MFFPPRPAPVLTVRAEGRFTAPSCSAQHHWPTILELVAHCGHAKKPGDESRSMKLLIAGDNSPFQETILEAVTFSSPVLFSFPFSAPYLSVLLLALSFVSSCRFFQTFRGVSLVFPAFRSSLDISGKHFRGSALPGTLPFPLIVLSEQRFMLF